MFRKLRQRKFQFKTSWGYTARPVLTKNTYGTCPERFNLDSRNLFQRTQAFSAATNVAPEFKKSLLERCSVLQDDHITMPPPIWITGSKKYEEGPGNQSSWFQSTKTLSSGLGICYQGRACNQAVTSCHLEGRNPENKNQFPTGMLMFSGYSPNIMREDKSTGAKAIVPRQQTNTLAFWSDYNCMCILPTYTSHIDHRCWNKGKEVYFGTLWKSYLCKCMQLSLMYTHTHEPEKQNRYFFKQNEQDKNKIPKFHMEKLVELPRHRKQCNTSEVPVLFQSWIQC